MGRHGGEGEVSPVLLLPPLVGPSTPLAADLLRVAEKGIRNWEMKNKLED